MGMRARGSSGAGTAAVRTSAGPYRVGGGEEQGGREWVAPAAMRRGEAWPRRHRVRRVRRVLVTVVALGVLGAVVFAGLLMVTPGVGDAPALTRAFDRAHGAAYPGPPVPQRVADSLPAAEDQRFYSQAPVGPVALATRHAGHPPPGPGQAGPRLSLH